MKRGPLAGVVRLVLATLAVLGTALLPTLGILSTAHAAEPETWVSVSIDAMSPALPQPGGKVRLRGVVTNTSKVELSNLQVAFWRSLDPIKGSEGMTAALDSAANEPLGERVNGGNLFQNIPSDTDRTLAPGESTRFDLTAQVDDLGLTAGDAIYLIGVHVLGRIDPNGPDLTRGRGRIFMPLTTSEPTNPLQMTSLVVLTSRPSWLRAGVLADDHLTDELATGGRLRSLLDAAEGDDTSVAVDPALVQAVETMAQGYQVVGADGQTETGAGQAVAANWLDDLESVIDDGDAFRLLYGNPDVAALVHGNQTSVLTEAAAAGSAIDATADLRLLVLPTNGRADQAVVDAVDTLRPAAIVLSDSSAKGPGPLLRGPGGVPIVTYTSEALQGGPGPDPQGTTVKVRQRMLADTWLEATSAAAGSTVGRVRLISSGNQAKAAGPDIKVSWLRPSTLSALLAKTPSVWTQDFRYTAAAQRNELTADQLARIAAVGQDYQTYRDLMVFPAAATAEGRAVLALAASSDWRADPVSQDAYLTPVQQRLTRILTESVALTSNPRVLTTGRTATFPITVRNALPADPDGDEQDRNTVKVTIRFDSGNSQRLTVATKEVPSGIIGGASTTENADVQAKANGTVRVTAQLFTTTGRPVGRPVPIEVTATQAGTTGWFIAIAAGIVLLGGTALRIKQVTRERAAAVPAVTVSRPPEDAATAGRDKETLDV